MLLESSRYVSPQWGGHKPHASCIHRAAYLDVARESDPPVPIKKDECVVDDARGHREDPAHEDGQDQHVVGSSKLHLPEHICRGEKEPDVGDAVR